MKRWILFLLVFMLINGFALGVSAESESAPEEDTVTDAAAVIEEENTAVDGPLPLETILDRARDRALTIEDFTTDVEIVQVQGNRTVTTKAHMQASQLYGIFRLELQEPSVLRGQIIVADQETLEIRMYLPIADQIMIRDVESLGEEAGIGLDMDNLGGVFDFYDYDLILKESELHEEGYVYALAMTGFEDQTQVFWVRDWDWVPFKIEVYEEEQWLGTLHLHNVVFDQELSRDQLAELPNVKTFRP